MEKIASAFNKPIFSVRNIFGRILCLFLMRFHPSSNIWWLNNSSQRNCPWIKKRFDCWRSASLSYKQVLILSKQSHSSYRRKANKPLDRKHLIASGRRSSWDVLSFPLKIRFLISSANFSHLAFIYVQLDHKFSIRFYRNQLSCLWCYGQTLTKLIRTPFT